MADPGFLKDGGGGGQMYTVVLSLKCAILTHSDHSISSQGHVLPSRK